MPQLDIVAYVTQYVWALLVFLLLFSLVVWGILPRLQRQLALRAWAEGEESFFQREEQIEKSNNIQSKSLDLSKESLIGIFKGLCNVG